MNGFEFKEFDRVRHILKGQEMNVDIIYKVENLQTKELVHTNRMKCTWVIDGEDHSRSGDFYFNEVELVRREID